MPTREAEEQFYFKKGPSRENGASLKRCRARQLNEERRSQASVKTYVKDVTRISFCRLNSVYLTSVKIEDVTCWPRGDTKFLFE